MSSLFNDNPYFNAGFGLLGVGAILATARSGIIKALSVCQRKYLTTLEINSRDPAYRWLNNYLTKVTCHSGSHSSLVTGPKGIAMVPAPGIHYFKFNNRWFKLDRSREKPGVVDLTPFESVTLTCLGKHSLTMIQLVDAIIAQGRLEEKNKLQVFTAFAADWRPFGPPRHPRPLESVVLKEGQMESIVSDIQRFLINSKWYEDRGIPYRRGYLLHGPPGCGKSSAIQAIAGRFGYGLAVLSLSDKSLSDDRLAHLLNNLPDKTFLLLEDVDTVAPKRDSTFSNVTLSGLLNTIDGAVAADERIIFMTTNYPNRLDPALIRPGRIDFEVLIGEADEDQAVRMFKRFYPDCTNTEWFARFAANTLHCSPAVIQGILINHPDNPEAAISSAAAALCRTTEGMKLKRDLVN